MAFFTQNNNHSQKNQSDGLHGVVDDFDFPKVERPGGAHNKVGSVKRSFPRKEDVVDGDAVIGHQGGMVQAGDDIQVKVAGNEGVNKGHGSDQVGDDGDHSQY